MHGGVAESVKLPAHLIAASKKGVTGVTICSIRREMEGA